MPTKTLPRKTAVKAIVEGLDIVAIAEVAERIGVPRVTVEKWKQRSEVYRHSDQPEWAFPEPRWTVANGRTSLWLFDLDIMPWIVATGREHYLDGKARAGE